MTSGHTVYISLPEIQRANVLVKRGLLTDPGYVVCLVGKLRDFKGVGALLNAAAIYESHLGDVPTLIKEFCSDHP